MIKNKKGSHVSFIISFILFISFLIFFIGIIKPFEKTETGKGTLLKHLENEIINDVSAEVMVVSAFKDSNEDCLEIDSLSIQNSISRLEGDLVKIYYSEEFDPNPFPCNPQTEGYKIGLVRSQKYILESKVENLKNQYENKYVDVKTKFKIPETNDFEFSFLGFDEIPITTPKETPPTEVIAELVPITYLDDLNENPKIKNGYIKIILW